MITSAKLLDLLSVADPGSLARGQKYFVDGAVLSLRENDRRVRAMVRGTHDYIVEFSADGAEWDYRCTCPVGAEGSFCKHAVAVVYACLENAGGDLPDLDKPSRPRNKRKTQGELIDEYLANLEADTLRDWLSRAAIRDKGLRDELLFEARTAHADNLSRRKAMIREAVRLTRPLGWRETGDYVVRLNSVAERLRDWLNSPDAPQVVELTELAIKGAEKSLEMIDDSGGDVMPAIMDLVDLHRDACEQVHPEPLGLAERLFKYQIDSEWDTFDTILPGYEDALGETGLARYRELVREAWQALPPLPADHSGKFSFDWRRMRLERAMASLAEAAGDVDALIDIQAKNLSSPYRYLQLAELSSKHGRHDDALSWALQGIEAFGEHWDARLLRFCIEEYLRRGEHERANEFAWRCFERAPGAAEFSRLMTVAEATDSSASLRERALRHLWDRVAREESGPRHQQKNLSESWLLPARSELVQICLGDGDAEAAWQVFIGGPVSQSLWMQMAKARGSTHPQDAIELYHQLLPEAVSAGTSGARYDWAGEIVRCIGELHMQISQEAEFSAELSKIRLDYRAKRNFMKLLDRVEKDL